MTLITMLIWLYAEANNLRTYPVDGMMQVPLTIEVANPHLAVVEQSVSKINVQFRGAQREVAKLSGLQARGIHIVLERGEPTAGDDVVLEKVLPTSDPINSYSVNLTRIDPPTVRVVIEKLVRMDVPLAYKPDEVQLVADSVSISPATVALTLPSSKRSLLGDDPEKATLAVEPLVDLKSLPADVEQTVRARIKLPAGLQTDSRVRVEPPDVELKFVIDKLEDSEKLASVPVWIMAPPPALTTYDVKLHEDDVVLRDVKITGPEHIVQQVRDGKIRVIAKLRLSADDLAKAVASEPAPAPVEFDVWPQPPTGTLRIESTTTTVRYTVVKRGG
ncbi:MAG: hypothetical protein GC159_16810 [Phycisphaera sp.]|nr:hypothetical protein [Phycisphaera sp.]